MSKFIVRPSKYRHVYGTGYKRDLCYDNLKVSRNAWDTNLVKVNPLFISVNLEAGGGKAFQLTPKGVLLLLLSMITLVNYPKTCLFTMDTRVLSLTRTSILLYDSLPCVILE
jgi:hypothetical protein